MEDLAQELSGLDLGAQFDSWLRSTDELPLTETLAKFGVSAVKRAPTSESDNGGRCAAPEQTRWYGLKLRPGTTTVAYVIENTPASKTGLSAGDEIIALDQIKASYSDFVKAHNAPGEILEESISFFRGDELQTSTIQAETPPKNTWTFTLANCDGEVAARRKAWIGV